MLFCVKLEKSSWCPSPISEPQRFLKVLLLKEQRPKHWNYWTEKKKREREILHQESNSSMHNFYRMHSTMTLLVWCELQRGFLTDSLQSWPLIILCTFSLFKQAITLNTNSNMSPNSYLSISVFFFQFWLTGNPEVPWHSSSMIVRVLGFNLSWISTFSYIQLGCNSRAIIAVGVGWAFMIPKVPKSCSVFSHASITRVMQSCRHCWSQRLFPHTSCDVSYSRGRWNESIPSTTDPYHLRAVEDSQSTPWN